MKRVFTIIKLLFLRMESGDFGKSALAAVSGKTKRILCFNKKVRLRRDPLHNNLSQWQKQALFSGRNFDGAQSPAGITLEPVLQLSAAVVSLNTGPI